MSTNLIWDGRTMAIRESEAVRDLIMNRAQIEADLYTILGDEVDAVLDPINKTPILLKEFQEILLRQQRQLAQAEQLAQLGSWTWDISSDSMKWSEGFFNLHGQPYREEEFDLATALEQVHPEDRERVRGSFKDAAHTQNPFSVKYRIIRPHGEVRTLLARAYVLPGYQDTPTQLRGIGIDISDTVEADAEPKSLLHRLRETEKKLRNQNDILEDSSELLLKERQRYQDLFEFAPDGYLVTDMNGIILEANRAAAGLFQTDQELLSSQPLGDFIDPGEMQNFQSMLNQLRLSEKVLGWESNLKLQSGEGLPVVMIVASHTDLGGQVLSLRWQLHDIRERKFDAESLRANQQKLNSIITGAPLLLWTVDSEKRITYFEGKTLITMGVNGQEFLGHSVSKFFQDSPEVTDFINSALAGDETIGTLKVRDRVLETRFSPLRDKKKEITGVIGLSIDITAQKKLETDLAELNNLLVLGRENDRFLLSREIHDGPVQDLYGMLFHFKAFSDTLPVEVNQEPIQEMHTSIQRVLDKLRAICGDLRPPTLAPFGLEKAIRSHSALIQETNPNLELELDLMSDGQELPELVRLALFRIYQQALSNVYRHANARTVFVHLALRDDNTVLVVQDDGDGFRLPENWIEFARENSLGLIEAFERARAVGGQLLIETAPGRGTNLRAVVPR